MTQVATDVLVIGGHLAGVASAIRLADAGRRVHLLLREAAPRPTLAIPLIFPNSRALLAELGVSTALEAVAGPRLLSGTIQAGTLRVRGRLAGAIGAHALRPERLAALLLARAEAVGVTVERCVTVRQMRWEGERLVGASGTLPGGTAVEWRAGLVIVAEDATLPATRALAAADAMLPIPHSARCIAYFEGVPPLDEYGIATHLHPDGYTVHLFEADGGLTGIAVEMGADHLPAIRADHEAHFTRLLMRIPEVARRLRHALRVTPVWGSLVAATAARPLVGAGWVVLRTAAAAPSPLFGQEIYSALRDASLVSRAALAPAGEGGWQGALTAALAARDTTERPFIRFAAMLGERPGLPGAGGLALLRAVAHNPVLADSFMGIFARRTDPTLFLKVATLSRRERMRQRLRHAWDATHGEQPLPLATPLAP